MTWEVPSSRYPVHERIVEHLLSPRISTPRIRGCTRDAPSFSLAVIHQVVKPVFWYRVRASPHHHVRTAVAHDVVVPDVRSVLRLVPGVPASIRVTLNNISVAPRENRNHMFEDIIGN